jgi:ribosomal protein L11 methyltransferase
MSADTGHTFSVRVSIGFEDPHCRELVISDLLQVAYCMSHEFLGVDMGEAAPSERTLDEAEAPSQRDLVELHSSGEIQFFFSQREAAEKFVELVREKAGVVPFPKIKKHPILDWNKRWRDGFTGVSIPPFWRVEPIWNKASHTLEDHQKLIWMNPSLGFGTGEHATTQMCLQLLGELGDLKTKRVLDFGAGSGILAVGAAKLGASVDAIEIDSMAFESARECARLNSVDQQIQFGTEMGSSRGTYDVILANILRNVLIDHRLALTERLKPGGCIILSGFFESDIAEILKAYEELLGVGCLKFTRITPPWAAVMLYRS